MERDNAADDELITEVSHQWMIVKAKLFFFAEDLIKWKEEAK